VRPYPKSIYTKKKKKKVCMGGRGCKLAQVVECLFSKHKTLSSNPSTDKKKRKKERKKKKLAQPSLQMCPDLTIRKYSRELQL
jgi:hypothetical protein